MTEITAAAIAPAVLSINGGGGAGGILLGADCRDVPVLGTGLMLSPCIKLQCDSPQIINRRIAELDVSNQGAREE
eukprot:scaffold93114_cov64-Phaeocystis_antarctica.AAC.3